MPGFSDDGRWLPPQRGAGLVARDDSPLPDAPLPIGFVILETHSRGHLADDGARSVHHVYQGRTTRSDAIEFYRRHLRDAKWRRVVEEAIGGVATLWYTKGPEDLVVRIEPRRDGVVTIRLQITDNPLAGTRTPWTRNIATN